MGLVLDSTVFIAAERQGLTARQTPADIASRLPGEQFALSVVTVIELAHGVARADSPQRKTTRQRYFDELVLASPVHPVTIPIALRAGQIDGESTAKGIRIAFPDLLIGVTALELGYRIATANLRHFQAIPGLAVLSF
ncbi:MAG TPA: PIN domain-containing protein [Terracidiphilus sp.]|nr:PIN domain-containing protein [Terracidiphilus sp.]